MNSMWILELFLLLIFLDFTLSDEEIIFEENKITASLHEDCDNCNRDWFPGDWEQDWEECGECDCEGFLDTTLKIERDATKQNNQNKVR